MGLFASLQNGLVTGILQFLDSALITIKNQLASGGEADEQVKKACATVVVYEQELRAFAAKSDNTIDDLVISEIIQAADQILGTDFVSQIRSTLHVADLPPPP